ncbi:MAG: 3-oxoadipate enol-lactonase [Qingshengfaniella sp.]
MHFTQIDGTPFHLSRTPGTGRPIVFLNSLGTDLRIWDAVAEALPGRPLLRYDKRGHGLSGGASDDMARHVDDAIALITQAGLDRPLLCGVSVGGLIAIGVAGKRPDLVGGLVLCNTAARIGAADSWADRIAAIRKAGIASIAEATMERWFSPGFRADKPVDLAGWQTMLTRSDLEGYIGVCAAIRDTDFTALAQAITVPTQVVGGSADLATPPDIVTGLADTIPGATLTMIEGCGHLPCIEAPAALLPVIHTALEEMEK